MTAFLFDGDAQSHKRVLLAHGAGAGMDSPFMRDVAAALAARGAYVARFEFPYMHARREGGARRAIDRAPVLLRAFRDAVSELGDPHELVIGGKSMGGRYASMLADELSVRGVLVFGYPFHPPDKPAQLRTAHLEALATPALFVQGTRDEFGTRAEVAGYALSPQIELAWIEDGDHSLKTRVRSGLAPKQAFALAIERAAAFVDRLAGQQPSQHG